MTVCCIDSLVLIPVYILEMVRPLATRVSTTSSETDEPKEQVLL